MPTYSDLITNRKTDYKFDLDRFTSTTGKTGLYIQYALVRAKLLQETNIDIENSPDFDSIEQCDLDLFRRFANRNYLINFRNVSLIILQIIYRIIKFITMYQSENILNNVDHKKLSKLKITWIFTQYSTSLMNMLELNLLRNVRIKGKFE